jgi:hypothetical protein
VIRTPVVVRTRVVVFLFRFGQTRVRIRDALEPRLGAFVAGVLVCEQERWLVRSAVEESDHDNPDASRSVGRTWVVFHSHRSVRRAHGSHIRVTGHGQDLEGLRTLHVGRGGQGPLRRVVSEVQLIFGVSP